MGPSVLVVDDDHDAAEALAALLRHSLACEVAVACDGAEALDKAAEVRPQVIIMDIQMPGVGGLEAVQLLRRLYKRPPKCIALTGLDSEADRRRIEESGFEAHLVKPVDVERLFALVAEPSGR